MPRPMLVTAKVAKEMTKLRDKGVPVAVIARTFGFTPETVKRNTSQKDRARIIKTEKDRQQKMRENPEWVEQRRAYARAYAARQRQLQKEARARRVQEIEERKRASKPNSSLSRKDGGTSDVVLEG